MDAVKIAMVLTAGVGLVAFSFSKAPTARVVQKYHKLPFKHSLMAHRGGADENVENTLPAFRHAASIQADILELDVHLTRDKQVVVFHDMYLGRMCGPEYANKRISDYNFDDLPTLAIPSALAHLKSVVNNPDSTKIPLLEQLFTEFPDCSMQIDVKLGSEELIVLVGKMILQAKREKQTVWGSFKKTQNDYCSQHFGAKIPLFFGLFKALKCRLLYAIGCMSLMHIYESALIMPNVWFFSNPRWIEALGKRGVSVIVFGRNGTIDDAAVWDRLRLLGVNGICSNSPTLLKAWLANNKLAE